MELAEELDMLALKYPELEKAVFCLKEMSFSKKWYKIRVRKELWEAKQENLLRKEKIKGRAQGIADDKLEIAKKALAKGLSVEIISDITGLDIKTIRCLKT